MNLTGSSTSSASTLGMPDMPWGPDHPWYHFHNQRNAIPPGAPKPKEEDEWSTQSSGTVGSEYVPSDEDRKRSRNHSDWQDYQKRGHRHQDSQFKHRESTRDPKSKKKGSYKHRQHSTDDNQDSHHSSHRRGGGRGGRGGGKGMGFNTRERV